MLPPISAVSAADASFQPSLSKQENASTAVNVIAGPQAEFESTSASGNARAVSGEVKLGQHLTVLAEALGKLMRIARADGETPQAYVNRLITTIQTLPADQKATLERELSKVLQGLTFAMLADALKNSAGQNAARVAIIFELARANQAGIEARTSVASYLQEVTANQSALPASEPLLSSPASAPEKRSSDAPTIARPGPPSSAIPAEEPESPDRTTSNPDLTSRRISVADRPDIFAKPQAPASEATLLKPNLAHNAPETITAKAASTPPSDVFDVPVNTTSSRVSMPTAQIARALPEASSQQVHNDVPDAPLSPPPLLVPRLDSATIKEQFAGASAKDIEKLLMAVLLGKLPSRTDAAYPESEHSPQKLPPEAERMNRLAQTSPSSTPQPRAATLVDPVSDGMMLDRAEVQMARGAASAIDAKHLLTEHAILNSAFASLVTKEGTPLPFVQYPPEKDDAESDTPPRGRWPDSSDEGSNPEEQSQEEPDDETSQEERLAANDEEKDRSLSEGAREDGRVGEAESYYLRMSNFA